MAHPFSVFIVVREHVSKPVNVLHKLDLLDNIVLYSNENLPKYDTICAFSLFVDLLEIDPFRMLVLLKMRK